MPSAGMAEGVLLNVTVDGVPGLKATATVLINAPNVAVTVTGSVLVVMVVRVTVALPPDVVADEELNVPAVVAKSMVEPSATGLPY